MTKLLEVNDLRAFYGKTAALHGINFNIDEGSVTALLGANGAGKSTTLRAISGMVKRTGDIKLNDQSLMKLATKDIVRKGVAHVPDGRGTFMKQSVENNLQLGAMTRRDKAGSVRSAAISSSVNPAISTWKWRRVTSRNVLLRN